MARLRWLVIAVWFCCAAGAAEPLTVDGSKDGARPVVRASMPAGFDAAKARECLKLVRLEANGDEGPAVFGEYHLAGETVELTSEVRLSAGEKFRAVLKLPDHER